MEKAKSLQSVLTTQEVAEILGIRDGTVRTNIINGTYDKKYYDTRGKIHLFDKNYILELKK